MNVLISARTLFSTVLAVSVPILLTACVGEGSIEAHLSEAPLPTPSPPVWAAGEADALADGMEILREYNRLALDVTSDYSVDASLLSPYMTDNGVDGMRTTQNSLEERALRVVGESTYSNEQVQDIDSLSGDFVLLVCEDIREIRVIDSTGADVTPSDRGDFQSLQVEFVNTRLGLRMEAAYIWDGSPVC